MQGALLVDKPAGWTSFDVVNYVRKLVAQTEGKRPKQIKVGHTGTLDPFATGLLVLLVGKDYTRRAGEFSSLDKIYEVTARLGVTSSTGDPEGEITPINERVPDLDELQATIKQFIGSIQQTPPAYSAIKVNGQRAYKLARAGKEVVIEPRQITVNRLEIIKYAYPEVQLLADVSSGTYIRTLIEDLGQSLGTGAYTTGLRRTSIGQFSLENAHLIKEFSEGVAPTLQTVWLNK
jgi:tRNA pseudouridine55 synthase